MKNFLKIILLALIVCQGSPAQTISDSFLENASITGITSEDGYIWVSTYGQGIYRYSLKDGKWINFSTKNQNLDNDLFYNIAVSKDYVWAGAAEGLFIYEKKKNKWNKRKFTQGGEFGNWIRSLCYDKFSDQLWIGRFRNITLLDVKKQKFVDYDRMQGTDQKTNTFKSIKIDGDSLIWFGTESGVHIYNKKYKPEDPKAWRFITNKGKFFNGEGDAVSVTDFLFEGGNIWFATDEFVTKENPGFNLGGIYKYDRKLSWKRFYKGNGIPGNGVYCIERTGNYIWAGIYTFDKTKKETYGKGLAIINRINNEVKVLDLNMMNFDSADILSMLFDGDALWIGTEKGLLRLNFRNELAVYGDHTNLPTQK